MPAITGVIGISSTESARYALFYSSLTRVEKPPHTALAHSTGSSIAANRNAITEQALAAGAEWIWYVDDDHLFQPTTLTQLLARNVDIVSGLYLQRGIPFGPQMYDREAPTGAVYPCCLSTGDQGLQSVLATGAGCLLVRTSVFKTLDPPYWRLGQIDPSAWGDDIDFCRRVRAAGYTIWCDLDVPVGHLMTGALYPVCDADGTWHTTLCEMSGAPICVWPATAPTPVRVP